MKFAWAVYTEFAIFLPPGPRPPSSPGRGWIAPMPRSGSILTHAGLPGRDGPRPPPPGPRPRRAGRHRPRPRPNPARPTNRTAPGRLGRASRSLLEITDRDDGTAIRISSLIAQHVSRCDRSAQRSSDPAPRVRAAGKLRFSPAKTLLGDVRDGMRTEGTYGGV
jgi:hypothetical protein